MISAEVEKSVVARIFSDASRLGWSELSGSQRSAQYAAWVSDQEVGGQLTKFMTTGQARVWIKDGPMKEWARATSGVGKYAAFAKSAERSPAQLVKKGLGEEWDADLPSL